MVQITRRAYQGEYPFAGKAGVRRDPPQLDDETSKIFLRRAPRRAWGAVTRAVFGSHSTSARHVAPVGTLHASPPDASRRRTPCPSHWPTHTSRQPCRLVERGVGSSDEPDRQRMARPARHLNAPCDDHRQEADEQHSAQHEWELQAQIALRPAARPNDLAIAYAVRRIDYQPRPWQRDWGRRAHAAGRRAPRARVASLVWLHRERPTALLACPGRPGQACIQRADGAVCSGKAGTHTHTSQ